jgi:PD-(D/E)XK nuclease superfamily protein
VKTTLERDRSARRFVALIDAYTRQRSGVSRDTRNCYENLLNGYQEKLSIWRKSQEHSASDFNLLETLKIVADEIRHSMMLEWLLDHRIERAGTHAQGKLGFRLFLEEIGMGGKGYAQTDYFVSREVKGDFSRVDIEIGAADQFIIHLENKIYSGEARNQEDKDDQTVREWLDLQRRARHLAVNPEHVHGFFITLLGDKPSSEHFTSLPWHRVANVLEKFANHAKAPEASLFASHYARALRWMTQQIAPHEQNEQKDNGPQS